MSTETRNGLVLEVNHWVPLINEAELLTKMSEILY